jgi:hypothetical protein
MIVNDWCPIELQMPPYEEEVEWQRCFYDTRPFVAKWTDFPPWFNVAYLSWRPLHCRLAELKLT